MANLKLADGLSLPLETVTEKLAWLGRTGSGKTYGAMKLAELMLAAGAQVGALDPVGVWRALRVPAEKGGQSFEVVVFGGLYGDLPLEPTAGELIADLVVDRGLSFVLDVSQFIPSEQQRFVKAFADRFFHRKKAAPSAVHLFMEECQEFIPENPSGLEALTLGSMQRLWKLGRNFGIGGSLISQRPQEIAKKALNMSGTLFAFQMTGPQERKAIRAWVADHGVAVDIESVLQRLEQGQPHVESPTFLQVSRTVRILPRVTADLSSTPKVGASTVAKRPLTPIDVELLKTSMAATIERAKADDPRELRKRIAELERAAKAGNKITAQAPPSKVVEKPVITDAQLARIDKQIEKFDAAVTRCADILTRPASALRSAVEQLAAAVKTVRQPQLPLPGPSPTRQIVQNRPANGVRPPSQMQASAPGDATLGKCERAIMAVLANQPEGCTAGRLTVLARYSWSGTFSNAVGRLRTLGYLVGANTDVMRATDVGLASIGQVDPLPTGPELAAYWLQNPILGKCERSILSVLLQHPKGLNKDELTQETGYEFSGTFSNALGRLRTIGVLVGKNTETMFAHADLVS